MDVAGFPNVVRRKEFFVQILDMLVTDIAAFQKKKKKRADSPKVIERHRFQARQTHILGINIY